jgi:hypothetical protein
MISTGFAKLVRTFGSDDRQSPKQLASSQSAPLAPTDLLHEATVISYRPRRQLEQKLKKYQKYELHAYFALIAGLLISTALLGMTLTLAIGFVFSCLVAAFFMFKSAEPSFITLNDDGVSFRWGDGKRGGSRLLPWSSFANASICEKGGRQSLRLVLFPTQVSPLRSRLFSVSLPGLWKPGPTPAVELALGAFSHDDRKRMLAALTKGIGEERLDRDVLNALNPITPASYTSLWLDSLNCAPVRASEELLKPDTMLANGRYRIVKVMGAGGQGTVYEAVEIGSANASANRVVLKEFVLPSSGGFEVSTKALDNIGREAKLLENLDNKQIVRFHDYFVEDHRAYLALEYIDGPSLKELVELKGALPESTVRNLAIQMCSILAYLHGQSPAVIHRDFSPENLILSKDGTLKLIDFNVALQLESAATRTIVGKHSYIPPEQFRGKPTTQSDIYAAGATMHFLLSGQDPEPITTSHPGSQAQGISDAMDAIVARATSYNASERYATVDELVEDLKRSDKS